MRWVAVWWKTVRGPFFTTSIVPVLLGTSIALWEKAGIDWTRFILSIAVVLACHGGSNLLNDYYDHLSTNDDINTNRSPFNGGSGSIQEGIVVPADVRKGGIICYILSWCLGLVLFLPGKPWGLIFVILGIASGFCYSKFPGLSYMGLGELVVGISFGPLIVSSAYFVQTGYITVLPILVSVPIGLLVAAVLYINQFLDFEADKAVNKKNLVVRLGIKGALPYYYFLLASAYLVLVAGVGFHLVPAIALIAFLTLPLAVTAGWQAAKWCDTPKKLLPANAYTIAVQFGVGILLTVAFVWRAMPLK